MQDDRHSNSLTRATPLWARLAFLLTFLALLAGTLSAAEPDRVAILLRDPTLRALEAPLRTYITDVEQRFPVKLQIVAGDWKTPEQVRAAIKDLHEKQHISGVILVGAMPMHRFFMHEHANPNPVYYEDFDLKFVDRNKDGYDDAYEGKPQLKLWVANIRATEKSDEDALPALRHFFAKTHDYYTGKAVPELRTLFFNAEVPTEEWVGQGDWFKRRGGARFSKPENLTILEGKGCTHQATLEAFKKHSYSLTCVALHSDETGHALHDGDLMAQEIADFKTGSLITISHGCFAANWNKTEHDNNGPNCGLSWVFGKHFGQAVVGQVRSGGIGFDNLIYERLRAGDYLGKAYLPSKQAHETEALQDALIGDYAPGEVVSGNLLIGNPFLELKPVKRDPGNRLVIRNAVYGDLANNAVVNVTQKVADWVEDSLAVQANAEYFGDPANGIEKQLKVDYTLDGVEKTMLIDEGETRDIKGLVETSAKAEKDQVAVLLNEKTYLALQVPLEQYIQDVETRFPVKLNVVKGKWQNPQEVRGSIKKLHGEKAISGVILVGAMPMHRFFMHEHPNPNPVYYEDFDLKFVDRNKDGYDDAYEGKPQLKLWVANIRATEKSDEDALPALRHFFAKTHDYYTGKAVPEARTLLFSGSDWPGTGNDFKKRGGTRFSTPENVTMLEGKVCTHDAALKALKKHSYSLTYVGLHSDETGHGTEEGDLTPKEIANLRTGSLITISHGCFAANWAKNEHDNSGPNCAISWVFGKHLGQAVVGQVRSGGIGFDTLIYERLRAGDYLGKAYLPAKQAHETEAYPGDHIPGDIVSGNLLIGNPFLQLKPVKRDRGNKLVIRNAVYGDLANNAVVNVTQKVADWIEDSLPVEANADNFGDPANGIEKQLKVDYTLDGVAKTVIIEEGKLLEINK